MAPLSKEIGQASWPTVPLFTKEGLGEINFIIPLNPPLEKGATGARQACLATHILAEDILEYFKTYKRGQAAFMSSIVPGLKDLPFVPCKKAVSI